MISPDDAALVEREPALPGLASLLDEERFRARLARDAPGSELGEVRAHYLRYKPGTSCLVAYRVEIGGVELAVHALTWSGDAAPRFEKAAGRPLVAGPLGAGLLRWDDLPAAVWSYPNDLEVRALRRLADHELRASLLRKLAPESPGLGRAEVEPLAYKPGRRFVGALAIEGDARAVVKAYSPSAFALRAEARMRLDGTVALRLPVVLGRSERHRTALLDWLPGTLLSDLLRGGRVPAAELELAGAALAELHASDAVELAERDLAAESAGLLALAETLGLLLPERAAAATALARRLAAGLARRSRRVPVHGDLHAKQMVIDDGRVGLLDLDRAAMSSPAEDLGNLLAHVERDELFGRLPPGRASACSDALLTGYRRASRTLPPPAELDLQRAAALLRLAMQPFRNREAAWRACVEAMLDRVEAAERSAAGAARR